MHLRTVSDFQSDKYYNPVRLYEQGFSFTHGGRRGPAFPGLWQALRRSQSRWKAEQPRLR